MTGKISALLLLVTALLYALYGHYMVNQVNVKIENNNIVFHIQNQKKFITMVGILVSRQENDQNILWNYDTARTANFATIKLPTKIVMYQNPFPYLPETNFSKPMTDGFYKVSLLVDAWDDGAPQTWHSSDERNIDFSFYIKVDNNKKYHLC